MIIHFDDNSVLLFNDFRKFGWMRVIKISDLKYSGGARPRFARQLLNLGIDPLGKKFTAEKLEEILAKSRRPIKLVLLDQEKIAGIGNIYANEALFLAKISPLRAANTLERREIKKLHQAIITVLRKGIRFGGTSAADGAYLRPTGEPGEFQKHLKVYQRERESCFVCGGKIKRTNLGGRGTFFCPHCQK